MIKKICHTDFLEIKVLESDRLLEGVYDLFEKNINSLSTKNVALNLDSVLSLTKADIKRFDQLKSFFNENGTFFAVYL